MIVEFALPRRKGESTMVETQEAQGQKRGNMREEVERVFIHV